MENYYLILGIDIEATSKEVSTAYRKLAKINHPDMGGSSEMMILINLAYEVISNEELKKEYDQSDIIKDYIRDLNKKNTTKSSSSNNSEVSFSAFYWQKSSFELEEDSSLTQKIWKQFIEEYEQPFFSADFTQKYIRKFSKNALKKMKENNKISKETSLHLKNEIFPSFLKAGYILSKVLRDNLPYNKIYWDKFYKEFLSFFRYNIFNYLLEQDYKKVEEFFPEEFNKLSKRFFENQSFLYNDIDFNNKYLRAGLANSFIAGYAGEISFYESSEFRIKHPYLAFYGKHFHACNITLLILLAFFHTYFNYW